PELDKAKQKVENIKTAIAANKAAITNNDRTQYRKDYNPDKYIARDNELNLERVNLQRELAEAEREVVRYQQLYQSEQGFRRLAADKDTIMELYRQVLALPIEQKRDLLKGLVDGDIEVKPPSPE